MKRNVQLKTVSYVRVGGELVNTNDLNSQQKRALATKLKTTYLNALFQGKAVFYPAGEEPAQKENNKGK